jgi:hypothetical protein
MAYYNKIWLLIVNENRSKIMMLEERLDHKDHSKWVVYKVIWWTIHQGESDIQCLKREVMEEIGCDIVIDSLSFLWEYVAPAAQQPDRDVSIKLYEWKTIQTPQAQISDPDQDAISCVWIDPDPSITWLQPNIIFRTNILPDLIERKIVVVWP